MNSDKVKAGVQRAPHRSLLRACGLKDDDFEKPKVLGQLEEFHLNLTQWQSVMVLQ